MLVKVFLLLFITFVTSQDTSFRYSGSQRCQVTCGDDVISRHGNHVVQGKQGPKGEPGTACDLGTGFKDEYEELRRNASLLQEKVKFFEEKLFRNNKNRLLLCGSGVQDKNHVSDAQLQAASYWYDNSMDKYRPIYGRLYQVSDGGAWVAAYKTESSSYNSNERWIQVDYLTEKTITAVVTQGRSTYNEYVTSYNVLYKRATSDHFEYVLDESNNPKKFYGNSDSNTPVINEFNHSITARVFRINALTFKTHITLRFDFLEC